MHRFILNAYHSKLFVDHKDGNGLNNQKSNLRLATHAENNRNRKGSENASSIYKGVHKSISKGHVYWQAICRKGNERCVETYKTEEDAAQAYNRMAIELHGEFAKLNVL
jgi:hypothetical protein